MRRARACEDKCPRKSHAVWKPPANRPDPVRLLEESNKGRIPAADPDPLRPHAAVAVHLLSRRGAQHGRGPGHHAGDRAARAGLRRLPSAQLRRVRHAGTTGDLRHQRSGRNPARALGVGREAPGRQLRARLSQQRLQRRLRAGCGAGLRSIVPRAHGGVQPDAGAGRVVCAASTWKT